jgi:cytochrome c-type biogenesis protein CcmE
VDLSPRVNVPPAPRRRKNRRKLFSVGLLVLVLAAGGIVIAKFLTNSLDYYCNVDEVGVKPGCQAGRHLRIQGTVDKGTLHAADGVTTFDLSFNKVTVPVVYSGDPGGLFQECIPVVIHGVLRNGVFDGDDIEVKHSNTYSPANLALAKTESAACLQQG